MITTSTARRTAVAILAGDAALVALYVAYTQTASFHWFVHLLFNLDGEANVPAWYTSAQLLLAGTLFVLVAVSRTEDRVVAPWFAALAGAGLIFLSADEVVGVHENVTALLQPVAFMPRFNDGHGMWIPVYLAIIGIAALATMRSWLAVWRAERRGSIVLAAGVALFLAGAVGIEIISYGGVRDAGPTDPRYTLLVAAEEGLELLGASLMLFGSAIIARTIGPPALDRA